MGIRNLSFYVRIRNGNRGIAFSLTIRKLLLRMIMSKKFEDFNNPREKALQGMKDSIPASQWEENLQFLKKN